MRPGLPLERTVLAWQRTWLSAGMCGLLLLRLSTGSPVRLAVALAAGALAITALTWAGRRRAGVLRARFGPGPADPVPAVAARAAAVTAVTVALLGAAAAGLLLSRW